MKGDKFFVRKNPDWNQSGFGFAIILLLYLLLNP